MNELYDLLSPLRIRAQMLHNNRALGTGPASESIRNVLQIRCHIIKNLCQQVNKTVQPASLRRIDRMSER